MTMALPMVTADDKKRGHTMQTIKASEFKAKCLHIMDEVNRTGEEIVITKNGKPVSILKPYRPVPDTIFGLHKGKVQSKDDLIAPLDIVWCAE
jgi:prevent-host-death family protein